MNTQPTSTQKILARSLLAIFLLESCTTNLPINPQPQPKEQAKKSLTNLTIQATRPTVSNDQKETDQPKGDQHEQALIESPNINTPNAHLTANAYTPITNDSSKESLAQSNYSIRPTPSSENKSVAINQYTQKKNISNNKKANNSISSQQATIAKRKAIMQCRFEQPILVTKQAKGQLTKQVFIAQGGHQIRFKQDKRGKWHARVKEKLPVGLERNHKLRIIVTPDMDINQLVTMNQKQQAQLIHVLWSTVDNDIPVSYVLIGYQQSLLGGGNEDKEKEIKEQKQQGEKEGEKVEHQNKETKEEKSEKKKRKDTDEEVKALESEVERKDKHPALHQALTITTASHNISEEFIKTLWQAGGEVGEERYRDKALELLGCTITEEKDPKIINKYLKRLSTLGNVEKIVISNQRALPAEWHDKSTEEIKNILYGLYIRALETMNQDLPNLPEDKQASQLLATLELQYCFQKLLIPNSKEQTDIIQKIKGGIDELGLKDLSATSVVRRMYLEYLITEANKMDLYNEASHISTYIEELIRIAEIAQDKIEENPQERLDLRHFAGRLYNKIGDLSIRLNNDIGKQYIYYSKAAKLGNANAYYNLGLLHIKPTNYSYYDLRKAKFNLEEATRKNHRLASYQLGQHHEELGNNKLAISWYEQAAERGHPTSLYRLYENLKDTNNIVKGSKYLEQAAIIGHGAAQYTLGMHAWQNTHYKAAIHWFNQAAYQGILESCVFLGLAAAKGLGQPQDDQAALAYYIQAEKAGVDNPVARYGRAKLYERGKGIPQNLTTALNLYNQADKLGHVKAAYYAGKLHLIGQVPGSTLEHGYTLLKKAANAGVYKACLLLGKVYEYGLGIVADIPIAITWYNQASSPLNKNKYTRALALYHLGWLYKLGKGTEVNEAAALDFFKQAATISQNEYAKVQTDDAALQEQLSIFQDKLIAARCELEQTQQAVVEKDQALHQLQEESKKQETSLVETIQAQATIIKELQEAHQQAIKASEATNQAMQAQLAQEKEAWRKLQEEQALQQQNLSEQAEINSRLKEKIKAKESITTLVQQKLAEKEQDCKQHESTIERLKNSHEQTVKAAEASKKEIQAQLAQEKELCKNLKEEYQTRLAQQEADFKKQQEGKAIIDTNYIKEIIKMASNDKDKLEKVAKLTPNGKLTMDLLARDNGWFSVETMKPFTELDMLLMTQHPNSRKLTYIMLNFTQLTAASYKLLGEHLKNMPQLTKLIIASNKPGVEGIQALAPHLIDVPGLEFLDLHCNELGPAEMKILAPYLGQLTKLEDLYLPSNQLGAEGIKTFTPYLKKMTGLRRLYLSNNRLNDDKVAIYLAETLKETKVRIISMGANGVHKKTKAEVELIIPDDLAWYS